MASFFDAIDANKRNSLLLIIFLTFLVFVAISAFAMMFDIGWIGFVLGAVIAIVYALLSYYMGDKALLALSGAKPVAKEDNPYLYNLVEGLALAAATEYKWDWAGVAAGAAEGRQESRGKESCPAARDQRQTGEQGKVELSRCAGRGQAGKKLFYETNPDWHICRSGSRLRFRTHPRMGRPGAAASGKAAGIN